MIILLTDVQRKSNGGASSSSSDAGSVRIDYESGPGSSSAACTSRAGSPTNTHSHGKKKRGASEEANTSGGSKVSRQNDDEPQEIENGESSTGDTDADTGAAANSN